MAGFRVLVAAIGLLGCAEAAPAADAERGRRLYENHCTTCHESVVHVREQRRAQSLPELIWQITRWERFLDLDWRYEEVADVAYYLDSSYYRFPAPPGGKDSSEE